METHLLPASLRIGRRPGRLPEPSLPAAELEGEVPASQRLPAGLRLDRDGTLHVTAALAHGLVVVRRVRPAALALAGRVGVGRGVP